MNIEQDKLDLWAEINKLNTRTQQVLNTLETLTDLLKTLEEKIKRDFNVEIEDYPPNKSKSNKKNKERNQ